MDMIFWLPAGIVCLALALAVYFYRRKREAEQQARQNNALLSDFMATEMAMKASQLESYKAMLHNPSPQPKPQTQRSGGIDWEEINGNRHRF